MGNRIIKESICSSESIAGLTDFEFRLWVGLITQADDAGRGDARPAIIKGRVFPLRERVTVKDIDAALHGLAASGCVTLYKVDGRPYYWFPTWAEHQRVRDCKPKYPGIEEQDTNCQSAADCGELPQVAADCGLNPIQSESNTNPNPKPKRASRAQEFSSFWSAYPRKEGKGAAEKAFAKVEVSLSVLLSAIERQRKSEQWTKDDGKYIPNPSTWLNQRRWEDELTPATVNKPLSKPVSAQNYGQRNYSATELDELIGSFENII